MKQIIISFVLFISMNMNGIHIYAYDAKIGGIYYDFSDKEAEVTFYSSIDNYEYNKNAYSGNVVIPETVIYNEKKYTVTSIGYHAFNRCTNLTSVTIPNSVTSISKYAFAGCYNLKSVTIPNSMTSIGSYAFSGSGLTSVTIPNSVMVIEGSAFQDCTSLTSVTIPNSVETIWDYAFSGCSHLESVIIGTGVLTIGKGIFYGHEPAKVIWLTNTPPSGSYNAHGMVNYVANDQFSLGQGRTVIYPFLSSMFEVGGIKYVPVSPSERTCDAIDCVYNDSITNLRLSNKITYKGVEMTLQKMKPYLFYNNRFLKHIELALEDTSQRVIPAHAFESCGNIEKLVIPNNITSIGEYALSGCTKISTIKVPPSVNSIGNYAFESCKGLKEFLIEEREKVINLGANGGNPLFSDCPLDSVYIGGNISYSKYHGYSPFYRNTSLRTVVITDKETEISENEFYGCTNLQDVKIGDGVESFGDWAFSGCSNLKHLSFGTSVKSIGKETFSDCTAVTQIVSRAATPPTCGSQALDDISKWECTLSVPANSIAAYQKADQWKEFFFIKDIESGIAAVNKEASTDKYYYSPNGRKHSKQQKGLNIVVMQDGTTRKVVVR